jgi:hypothetical protein
VWKTKILKKKRWLFLLFALA